MRCWFEPHSARAIHPGPLEPQQGSALQGKVFWVNIDFQGMANSPTGFAILNGLQLGTNCLWNVSLDRQVAKNLQLRFSYEGRKTGESRVVNAGRVQVGAVL